MARAIIATGGAAVTPANAAKLPKSGSLYITTGGTIKITMLDGSVLTLTVDDFTWLPLEVVKVWSTGTDATGIFVFY